MFIFGKGTVQTILDHRAKAISAVNKALSTQDRAVRFSDATLGAVFNLLTVEEGLMMPQFKDEIPYDEQPNAMNMHLNGLREMLNLRGGLKAVGTNRILQAFILWHTTAHAIAQFNAPLEPYLNVPSPNTGNAESPPGPLQNNLKETELTDWRTIDWTAVTAAATPVQEAETSNEGGGKFFFIDNTQRVANELMSKYMALTIRVSELDTPEARRPMLKVRIDSGNG
ncbi:hypothetical protein E8E12_011501 [Didymella heteroderae]|uniref:Uncharacterized protein n=1 Tax=Didymella heteroderae TaxID=1769908 RepID=A0A9P5C5L7_9PLEO|nr:hypothetical protein E8E12_011501 [Didymella heteroderae]